MNEEEFEIFNDQIIKAICIWLESRREAEEEVVNIQQPIESRVETDQCQIVNLQATVFEIQL